VDHIWFLTDMHAMDNLRDFLDELGSLVPLIDISFNVRDSLLL
jgi:DNA transposition AAA+ family ATPase